MGNEVTIDTLQIELESNAKGAVSGLEALADSLERIKNITKGGLGFSAISSELEGVTKTTEKLASSNKKASKSFLDFGAKAILSTNMIKKAWNTGKKLVTLSNDYVENLNLFTISMGEYANEAQTYAENVSELMGIDPGEWMRNQGVFMTLATGFGIAGERANKMSEQLTQLGYDISSFFNIDMADAMEKLQSGISGELEPLRRLGYDLSQAKLEAVAMSLGIDKSVSSMTQAEKAQLRYYAIMTQVTTAHGDMARTIEAPANQLRVLKAQLAQTGRAIGNIFIPALTAVLPYVNALLKVVKALADIIAGLVGYELPEIDTSGVNSMVNGTDDITNGFDNATESAKKLQKYTMGFDELNVIDPKSGTSSANDVLGGGDLGFELPTYDFLESFSGSKVNEIVDKMKEWLGITDEIDSWGELMETRFGEILSLVGNVAIGLVAWKVTTEFMDAISTLKILLESPSYTIAVGVALTIAGITLEVDGIKDAIKNGLDGFNFGEILSGGLLTVGGTSMLGMGIGKFIASAFKDSAVAGAITAGGGTISTGLIGAIVGGLVAGIPMFVTGIYDAIVNGLSWLNGLLIPAGATMSGAAIGAIIGMLGGPMVAGIGALIGLAVGLVTDLIILIVQNWESICTWFGEVLTTIGNFFVDCWNGICKVWGTVSEWFDTWVIQPIVGFFSFLWEGISSGASACWNAIVGFFSPAIEWFSELFSSIFQTVSDIFYNIGVIAKGCWDIIVRAWELASSWFNTTVIQPVANFFSNLWESITGFATDCWNGICNVWSAATGWFNTYVITPVSDAFSGFWDSMIGWASDCWEGIKSVFSNVAKFFSDTFTAAWEGIVKVFSVAGDIFVDIKDGVVQAFCTVVNGIIGGINKVVKIPFDAINGVLGWLKDLNILGVTPFKGIKLISVPQIPKIEMKAEGGMVDTGQMFIAREAGPELVGTIGHRTAVVNNEQIIEGIANGVSVANTESNALLREQNSLLKALLDKDTGTYIDGRKLSKELDRVNRGKGVTILAGGAY